jgi:hypothetical protein
MRSFALMLSLAAICVGQTHRGQLAGEVTDPSGAAVVGAELMLTNLATGIAQKMVTNERGVYLLANIEPGQYRITASAAGFKSFVQEPITVAVSAGLTLNIALALGDIAEKVIVTSEAPLLETASASFGQVVSQRHIQELPLNVRNPMGLVTLTPGVITHGDFGRDGIASGIEVGRDQYGTDFQIGGGRTLANEVLLDGAPNTSVDRGYLAYTPPVDSTQEFKIEANSFSAEFDRTTGGVVNVVTKGGTNEFHGTAYEFYRSGGLDANDFFFNRSGQTSRPSWSRNQFGANIGGPVKRNQTFFFGNYEGLRQAVPFTRLATVPTAAQRRGDFSQTRAANGQLITIYDPLTTVRGANNVLTRQPFAGNAIPSNRWDAAGTAIMGFYPQPNVPGEPVTNANNYLSTESGTDTMNNYGARLDHNFSDSNRIFGRFSFRKDERVDAPYFDTPAGAGGAPTDRAYNVTISDIHVFSPSFTGELKASFARHHTQEISASYGFDLARLKLPQNYVQVARPFFPKVNVADMRAMGRDRYYDQRRDTTSVQGNVTKLTGRHSMKAGFDVRFPRFHLNRNLNSTGTFTFNRGMTQGPDPTRASATAGFGLASLLLGAGSGGSIDHTDAFTINRKYYGFYFQEDWKLTSTLTLNLGLRYNLDIGQNESHDRTAWMDLEAANPLGQQVGLPLRGLLRFAGDGGNSRNLLKTDTNNFSPRVGIAWQAGKNTAIRTGYGIYYAPVWISAYDINVYPGYNSNTPWVATLDGLVPQNYLSHAFPQGFNLPKRDRDPLTNVGYAISGWIRDEPVGYTQQWNFSIQQQVGSGFLIETAYWGNKGAKMENRSGWQENTLPNRYLALGNQLNELVSNPFYGVIPAGSLSSERVARRQLLLPFPQYTSVIRTGPSVGNSIYHAFTARVEKRLSAGLSVLASYTLSKSIDDFDSRPLDMENRRLERSLSEFDVPQRLVASWVYELPFGRQRRFGASLNPALDYILGGWTLSGIGTLQSGLPVAVSRPAVNNGTSARLDVRHIDRWFDTSVFAPAAPFTFGNVGRYLPDVRSDGIQSFDFTLAKTFTFHERYRAKFRAEMFNAFNTPQFGAPAGGVTSSTFGAVRSQANMPRLVQFGLQFYW